MKICRDCLTVCDGKLVECPKCRSSNLGTYYSAEDRMNATQVGSDWRNHLYVSGDENRTTKSKDFGTANPRSTSQAIGNNAKSKTRGFGTKRSIRSSNDSLGSLVRRHPFSLLSIVLFPALTGLLLLFPSSGIQTFAIEELRNAFGLNASSDMPDSSASATSIANLELRNRALEILWASRKEANLNGYTETTTYDTRTNKVIRHPLKSAVSAHEDIDGLSWGATSTTSTFYGLAVSMTDANLLYGQAGQKITFRHSESDCEGWIKVAGGLITGFENDCDPFGSGISTDVKYGLSEAEFELIRKAEGQRNE